MKNACLFLLALVACTESSSQKPAAAGSESRDRDALTTIVSVDMRASAAMREADDAATKGDAGAALEIVTKRATPAIDEGLG
ncbi:MAG TPA: hypothetical protein VIF62_13635, partial [Labilithrix sp.]